MAARAANLLAALRKGSPLAQFKERGSRSALKKALAQTPAGAAQVQAFHRELFASASESLRQELKRITGVEVREATAELRDKNVELRASYERVIALREALARADQMAAVAKDVAAGYAPVLSSSMWNLWKRRCTTGANMTPAMRMTASPE